MCCLLLIATGLGPRLALLVWWIFGDKVDAAFDTWVWPALGLLFLPWTTIMYVLFWAVGGLSFLGWLFIAAAFVLDIGTYGGGFFGNRDRVTSYYKD